MPYDLIPKSFFSFPRSMNWDDDDLIPATSNASGLSISEDEERVYIQAALPGVNPDDVDVTFEKGMLWIKGEANEEEDDKKKKFYRKATSSFSYRVSVPGEIDLGKEPEAESKDGMMTITFFKHPKSQPKKITVKAKKK